MSQAVLRRGHNAEFVCNATHTVTYQQSVGRGAFPFDPAPLRSLYGFDSVLELGLGSASVVSSTEARGDARGVVSTGNSLRSKASTKPTGQLLLNRGAPSSTDLELGDSEPMRVESQVRAIGSTYLLVATNLALGRNSKDLRNTDSFTLSASVPSAQIRVRVSPEPGVTPVSSSAKPDTTETTEDLKASAPKWPASRCRKMPNQHQISPLRIAQPSPASLR